MSNHDENPVYPIDVNIFKEHTCQSFIKILDSLPNQEKTLIIEKSCIFKLNYIALAKQLTEKRIIKKIIQNSFYFQFYHYFFLLKEYFLFKYSLLYLLL